MYSGQWYRTRSEEGELKTKKHVMEESQRRGNVGTNF